MTSNAQLSRIVDEYSEPYWLGLARGEIWLQRCHSCKQYVFYPRGLCPRCYSTELEWVVASGRGIIYSYTVVRRPAPIFRGDSPYVVALVDLAEDVRMLMRVDGVSPADARIGVEVEVIFVDLDGEHLPRVQPVGVDGDDRT